MQLVVSNMKTESPDQAFGFAYKKSAIITQLEKDILPLQGLKKLSTDNNITIGFRPDRKCFSLFIFSCWLHA